MGPRTNKWFHILEGFVMVKKYVRAYDAYDADAVSNETGLACKDESKAIQSQKDEADINTIVRNFGITGKLPENVRAPVYGDFDFVGDYRSAIEAVRAAEASFMAMPAEVRARFENDPGKFVDFCSDSANLEEMRKLGLAVAAAAPDVEVKPA